MASLYITEFTGTAYVVADSTTAGESFLVNAQVSEEPPLAEQKLTISGSSTASAALNRKTYLVRVHTDAICSIAVGKTTPTATTSSRRLAANQTEYFGVRPGYFISVITNT